MSALNRIQQLAVVGLVAVAAAGCDDATNITNGRAFGPAVAIGNGTARSYVEIVNGQPTEVGIEMTEAAMEGLPAAGDHMTHSNLLEMPAANPSIYQHLSLDWNAVGHEPAGVYDKPHFDFHFYTIPNAERIAIDPADPSFGTKAANHPAAGFMPQGYVPVPPPVPAMGVHWIDPTSPELNGQPFTRTFIYGSWNGAMTFAEPMITRAFLLTKPNATYPVPTADRAAVPGLYPKAYAIRFNQSTSRYEVALTNLISKN